MGRRSGINSQRGVGVLYHNAARGVWTGMPGQDLRGRWVLRVQDHTDYKIGEKNYWVPFYARLFTPAGLIVREAVSVRDWGIYNKTQPYEVRQAANGISRRRNHDRDCRVIVNHLWPDVLRRDFFKTDPTRAATVWTVIPVKEVSGLF